MLPANHSMTPRYFFLLGACLIGVCKAEGEPPRSGGEGGVVCYSQSNPARDASQGGNAALAVEEWSKAASSGAGNQSDLWQKARAAIEAADPSEFEGIWKALSGPSLEQTPHMKVLAIYHSAAHRDLTIAGRIARESMRPHQSQEEWLKVLVELFHMGSGDISGGLKFLRELEPAERNVVENSFSTGAINLPNLTKLVESGLRLNPEETRFIIGNYDFPQVQDQPQPSSLETKKIVSDLLEVIKSGERKGVFAEGATNLFLNAIGANLTDAYFQAVPLEERMDHLLSKGSERVIAKIIQLEFDPACVEFGLEPMAEDRIPRVFFTSTGTRNLPPEKTSGAIAAWHCHDPKGAETWFADNGKTLTQIQRDLTGAGFAKNYGKGKTAQANAWLNRITDPALRAKTVAELKSPGEKGPVPE